LSTSVHGGALLRDRHRQHRVSESAPEGLSGEPLGARRRGALADPDGDHTG
jgi:hypothetical protein